MLGAIRSGLRSWPVLLLLGVLIASFAVWGIPDLFSGVGRGPVAEVGGVEISDADFSRVWQQEVRRLEDRVGQAIEPAQAMAIGLPQQVVGQLISQTALDVAARRMGLRIGHEEVVAALREFEAFAGFDGTFDRAAYVARVARIGMTPARFEAQLRADIVRQRLISALTAAVPVPEALAATLYRWRKEVREAAIVSLPASLAGDIAEPDEEELRAVWETDKANYMTPAWREVAVTSISPADMARPDAVSREELEEGYEARIDRYRVPELRFVDMVTFGLTEEAKARRFVERHAAGEDFARLIEEMTDFTGDEVSLGDVGRADLERDYSAAVAEAVFAAPPGGLAAPAQSVFGWHVFRVVDVTPAEERTLDQVEASLRREVAEEKSLEAVYEVSVKAEDALARGAGLPEIAETLDIPFERVFVSRAGLLREGGVAPDAAIAALPAIWNMLPGDPASLEPTADGGFAIVDLIGEIAPEQQAFEEVRGRLLDRLLRQRRLAAVGEMAEQVKARLAAGEDPAVVATAFGGDLVTSGAVTRDSIGAGSAVAPVVARLMFQLAPGEAEIERAATGEGYVVVRLDRVRPGDPAGDSEGFAALRQTIGEAMLGDALLQFERGLRAKLGVEIHEGRIAAIVDPQAFPGVGF